MELIKNLFKYLIILIVIILLSCGLMAGIMFFFPNVQLFGFKFVANHETKSMLITNPSVKKINIETNNYDVEIMPYSDSEIAISNSLYIGVHNNYTGFSNGLKNVQFQNIQTNEYIDLEQNFNIDNATFVKNDTEYTIKIKEPTGLVSYSNSKIFIQIPNNADGVSYNIITNKGSISFLKNNENPEKTISTGDITLSVASARGSFNLDNASMKDESNLNIKNYIGRVNINSEKIGNVIIDSNSGNFTFKNIGYEGFNGGNLTVTGNNPYITANKIYGTLNFETTTGYVKVKELLGDGIINTQNGIIKIDKVLSTFTSKNKSGETFIKQIGEKDALTKSVTIESNSGAIYLGGDQITEENTSNVYGLYSLSRVTSLSGKVVINNLYTANCEVTNDKGSVSVNFAKNDDLKNLSVNTNSGAINLNNIYGNITAQTKNSSKITANFYKLSQESSFTTDGGDIEIVLPAPTNETFKQYKIAAKNKTNKFNILIGGFEKTAFEGEKDGDGNYNFQQSFPSNSTTSNIININSNSGKINIHEN